VFLKIWDEDESNNQTSGTLRIGGLKLIFVTGDTHSYSDIHKLGSKNFPQNKSLTKEDYLIITGDFGLVWDNRKDEKYWLDWLSKKNFTTLFIDGNHENFDLLGNYPVEEWCGGKVHFINKSVIHLTRGQVFNINSVKVFTFGGAQSHDKNFRIEGKTWWAQEIPTTEEFEQGLINLAKHNWNVDFVMTHTCSASTLIQLNQIFNRATQPDLLNDYLQSIQEKLSYRHWYFGHFHKDITLNHKQTLLFKEIRKLDF
jgi:hypothetical protein